MDIEYNASMMCANYRNLEQEVRELEAGGIDSFHIDIMDGRFVPNFAMSLNDMRCIRQLTTKPLDVHLMVEHPETQLAAFAEAGADIITFHIEAARHPHRIIQEIKALGCKAGIAMNPGTPLALIEELLADLDMVLIMTVNPGFGGQKFIPSMLDKIERLREIIDGNEFAADIQVDGGINAETGRQVREAGANILVAGSYVYGAADIPAAIASLRA